MATVLDIGLLKGFSDIFSWLLVFLIVYGVLEVTNLLKNRGVHALLAFVITAVVVITGGGINLITAMTPWFIVILALVFFMLLLGNFAGVPTEEIIKNFGGKSVVWYMSVPLFIILVVAWTQGAGSREKTMVDPMTGIATIGDVSEPHRPFLDVLTSPKVLGMFLILGIGSMTLALMAGGGHLPGPGH